MDAGFGVISVTSKYSYFGEALLVPSTYSFECILYFQKEKKKEFKGQVGNDSYSNFLLSSTLMYGPILLWRFLSAGSTLLYGSLETAILNVLMR